MDKISDQHVHSAESATRDVQPSLLDDLPSALMRRAVELQRRAAAVGFDWPEVTGVLAKIEEEIAEVRAELATGADPQRLADEVGDLLMVCISLARYLDIDPEQALANANAKFERRFRRLERWLHEAGSRPAEASLAEMDHLWELAKREEREHLGGTEVKADASDHPVSDPGDQPCRR